MKINLPIIVKHFNDHDNIKNTLLDFLKNQNYSKAEDEHGSITRTDWYVDVGGQRKYWEFLYPYLWPVVLDTLNNDLHFQNVHSNENILINYWFQQYHKNDCHNWHRHPLSSIGVVYFIELPENKATEFKVPQSQETYTPKVKEGDLVFFPSFLMHRSPPHTTNERKTVIAFNLA